MLYFSVLWMLDIDNHHRGRHKDYLVGQLTMVVLILITIVDDGNKTFGRISTITGHQTVRGQ